MRLNNNTSKSVLVVDDVPRNIKLLESMLIPAGYLIEKAASGEEALEKIRLNIPDLILLDVMMPGMDGYEVCRRLKEKEETNEIPVIFVTAKHAVKDEIKGLELGAVDYITKPISLPVVLARVRTHLALKRQNEILKENMKLREDVEYITRHDLKGPLMGIINYPEFVREEGNLSEIQQEYLQNIVKSGYKMLNIINLSLDLFKMEQGIYQFKPVPVDIISVINDIFQENRKFILSKKLSVEIILNGLIASNEDSFTIPGEQLLYYSMLANLIKNSIEASPEKEKITICFNDEQEFTISIHNLGAVPDHIRDTFFEKYVSSGKRFGTGLGTYSAQLIAYTQGGQISLDTSDEDGTTIHIVFPL
jgi:CheY-like chemotaxis protein